MNANTIVRPLAGFRRGAGDSLWVDFTLPQQEALLAEGEWVNIFPHGGDRDPVRGQEPAP